jgi:hypothetical protein
VINLEKDANLKKKDEMDDLIALLRSRGGSTSITTKDLLRECVSSSKAALVVSKENYGLIMEGRKTGIISGELVVAAFGSKTSQYNIVMRRKEELLGNNIIYGNVFKTLALSDFPRYRTIIAKFAKHRIREKDANLYKEIMLNVSLPQSQRIKALSKVREDILDDLDIQIERRGAILKMVNSRNLKLMEFLA